MKENEQKIRISNNSYRYYNFIKRHKGFSITVASIMAGSLAFVSNALQYYTELQQYKKWNLDTTFIQTPNNGAFLYELTYSVFLFFAIIIMMSMSSKCLKLFFTKKCEVKLHTLMNGYNEKIYKATKVVITELKNDDDNRTEQVLKGLDDSALENWFLHIKKSSKKQLWQFRGQVAFEFVLYFFIFYVLLLVGNQVASEDNSRTILFAFVDTLILFITHYCIEYVNYRQLKNKVTSVFAQPIIEISLIESLFNELEAICKKIKKQRKHLLKISDNEIKASVLSFVMTLLCTVFIQFTANSSTIGNTLNIFQEEKNTFVVALNNESMFFLKPAVIDEKTIEIDLTKTVIISDYISFQQRTFDSVILKE